MTEKFNIYQIDADNNWPNYGDWQFPERAKSVIYVFGRDEQKNKIIKKITNFLPYFYIKANTEIPITASKFIKSIIPSEKVSFSGGRLDKVFAINSKVIPTLRKELEKYSIEHYQADVLYRLNFSLTHHKNLEQQGIGFGIDNSRVWNIDIETTTREQEINVGGTPEDKISISLHDNYTNKYHAWVWRNEFMEGEKFFNIKGIGEIVLHKFSNETSMLNYFLDFWKELSPDIIVGWNSNNFDIPYIINRCKKIKVDNRRMSPVGRVWCWPSNAEEGKEVYYNPQIMGVVLLDAYSWYKEVHLDQLRSGALDAVAKDEGLRVKEKVNPQLLWETDWTKLIEYNVNDVFLTKAIVDKRKIIDFVSGIRKTTWSNFEDLSYFSRSIDMLLLQEADKRNVVLPTKPSGIKYQSKEERKSAYVGAHLSASVGVYHGGISVFDFSALYPSIYRTFNISYETLSLTKPEGRSLEFEIPKTADEEGEKIKVWVSQEKKGMIPTVLENLTLLRDKYDEGLKNAKTKKEADEWDNLVQAIKNLILTSYGATAMQAFRLFKKEVSSLVTFIGRTMIRELSEYAKNKGMPILYNHTDSFFALINSEDVEVGKKLETDFNNKIKEVVNIKWGIGVETNLLKLKFEKLYKSVLVNAKSTYAGHLIWKKGKVRDEIQIAGMQSKKSDSSYQLQYLQSKVIELVLKQHPLEEIEKEIFQEVEKIKNCEDYEYISIPTRLGKSKYNNDIPKQRANINSKKCLNLNFLVGQKPLLVYTDMSDVDCLLFEFNEQMKNKGIKVDVLKMIERNVLNPLENVLSIYKNEEYYLNLKGRILNQLKGQKNLWDFNGVASTNPQETQITTEK